MKILVTTGHKKSRYTLALLNDLLKNENYQIQCVEVKTFNFRRFKKYLKQYGINKLIKKFMINFFDFKTEISNETLPIKEYMKLQNIPFCSVKSFCMSNGIKHFITKNLNSENLVSHLSKQQFDIIIYSGGGILRKNFIKISKIGVLNSHSGYLPNFRGMNVIEWSLLHNFEPHTTIHFIDSGIDTGKILYYEKIPLSNDLYTIRGNAVVHNLKLISLVLNDLSYYIENSIVQKKEDGKQYFVMHDCIKNHITKKIKF